MNRAALEKSMIHASQPKINRSAALEEKLLINLLVLLD